MRQIASSICSRPILTRRTLYYIVLVSAGACAGAAEEPVPLETANVGSTQQRIVTSNALENTRLYYPANHVLGNGATLTNGFTLGNGGGGGGLPNGISIPSGAISPSTGSDLDKWIDESPTKRKKIIQYMVECALSGSD